MSDSMQFEDIKGLKKQSMTKQVPETVVEEAHNDSQLTGNFDQSRESAGHYMMGGGQNKVPGSPSQPGGQTVHYTQLENPLTGSLRGSIVKDNNRKSNRKSGKAIPPEGSQNCCNGCSIF